MAHVSVTPELLTTAAADLETIASTVDAAHLAAVPRALKVLPAAADEISTSVARLFSRHAAEYQAAAGRAAAYRERFAQNLTAGAAAYAGAEDVSALLLQGWNSGLRSIFTATEYAIFGAVQQVFLASALGLQSFLAPEQYGPAFLVTAILGGFAMGLFLTVFETIAESITGLPGPI